jgi:hypothetical protein
MEQYTEEQLAAGAAAAKAAGDMAAYEEITAALNALRPPPTQRLRAIGQGVTLGFADELLAGLQAPFGPGSLAENYNTALQSERDVLKQYRQDYPYSSTAYEVAGAIAPALFSGGAAAPLAAGRASAALGAGLRAGISGAKTGAVYGFGTGEGGLMERAANMGVQGVLGGAAGGVLGGAGSLVKGTVVDGLVNWLRNKAGDRMAGTVAREVQRLAEQGGLTADEVIQGVAEGRLMAENRTLETMIRRFYAEGGPAGAEIKTVLSARPGETRAAALQEMQGQLGSPGNPLANKRISDEAAQAAEDAAYNAAFRSPSGVELPAPDEVVSAMDLIASRAPAAMKAAAEVARVKYGIRPFFVENADGTITFARPPTLREAELTYRALRDQKGAAYTSGQGTLGGAYGDLAEQYKGRLDAASSPLQAARTEAANVRNARDAFKAGQEAARKSPDELALIIADIEQLGPDAMAAFREGLLTSIRAGLAKPSAAPALMRGLADEATGPGTALRLALPPGAAPQVTQRLTNAAEAQRASSNIIGGSQTAPTQMAPSVGGAVNVAQEAASGMQGDLMAWARLIGGLADNVSPRLTDAQRLEVARIVLSKDPALVERALRDNTLVGQLQALTAQAVDRVVAGGTRGVTPVEAGLSGQNQR